jgi:hypothetical protein
MMKQFIFFTSEGYTFDSNNKAINNMQILGDAEGTDIFEAFHSFKEHQPYLSGYSFKEVIALEYIGSFIHHLEL